MAAELQRTGARSLAALLLACFIGACASVPPEQRTAGDPWESMNRTVYEFNTAVDKVTLKPLAKGYEKVLPQPLRKSVTNFWRNLGTPGSAINNFLQGKPGHGFVELTRFLVNSSFGIGGLLDVASGGGLVANDEDFGQTAAVWGVPKGPYVMLPFLGPASLRDAVTRPLDIMANPLYHYEESSIRDKLRVLRLIDLRARLLSVEKLLQESKDPYITVRESYLQNREFQIYDGNPPEDDEFFDEFLEEDY